MSAADPYAAIRRRVNSDPRVMGLSPWGRLVFYQTRTTELGNALGLYRGSPMALAEELGLGADNVPGNVPTNVPDNVSWNVPGWFPAGFAENVSAGLLRYDARFRVIALPDFWIDNRPANPNAIKALAATFARIPDCAVKLTAHQEFRAHCLDRGAGFLAMFDDEFAPVLLERYPERYPERSPEKPVTTVSSEQRTENKPPCPEVPESAPALDPIVAEHTCIRGDRFELTESKVAEWRDTYVGVDVILEVGKALQFLRDNPAKNKTIRGMPAYLGRWLARRQDQGGSPGRNSNGTRIGGGIGLVQAARSASATDDGKTIAGESVRD